MEQRVEIFRGNYAVHDNTSHGKYNPDVSSGNALVKAKVQSEELLKRGWFIHQVVSQDFTGGRGGVESQLMVVYRRKG